MEAGRHHSDDIESPTAQPYGMSEGVRIPTEMTCAIRTADDYRTGASFVRLVDGEPASHHGLNSENVKKLRSNGGNVRILGYGTRGHGYVIVSIVRHAFECRVLIVPIVEVGCRYISDRKSTRLNSSHLVISYAVFCLKKKEHKKRDEIEAGKSYCSRRFCDATCCDKSAH